MKVTLNKLAMLFVVIVLLLSCLYYAFGHSIILSLYNKSAPEIFNGLIIGQQKHNVEFYFHEADIFLLNSIIKVIAFTLLVYLVFGMTWKRRLSIVFFNVAIVIVLFESFFLFCFNNAEFARKIGIHSFLFQIHSNFGWQIPQFEPECAAYDVSLGYKLKKGSCELSNYEFLSQLSSNSFGLPDDEASLVSPEVIVLGDSFSMGWGVDPNQTFSSILEAKTGMKVLNAGISSYGTVRELKLLNDLDTSKLKYLVLQYFSNDHAENRSFKQKGKHITMTRDEYDRHVNNYQKNKKYFFGRYAYEALKFFEKKFAEKVLGIKRDNTPGWMKEDVIDNFFNVLDSSPFLKENKNLKIVLFDASKETYFIDDLRKSPNLNQNWSNIEILDLSKHLLPDSYYDYDLHYRPKGHRIVADMLIKELT